MELKDKIIKRMEKQYYINLKEFEKIINRKLDIVEKSIFEAGFWRGIKTYVKIIN